MDRIVTRESLCKMLEVATPERKAKIVGRACVALFKRQTEAEKADNDTKVTNMRGFCAQDARSGSITAKYFIKHGSLQEWQIEKWTKVDVRGTPRIVKYWRQLDEEAHEKQTRKAA